MLNQNVADLSIFETLQDQSNQSMGNQSQMTVFNAFQITLPDVVKKQSPTMADFKYQSEKTAENDASAWRKARVEVKSVGGGKDIYHLMANGQRFTLTDKADADIALKQAKQVKVVEVK